VDGFQSVLEAVRMNPSKPPLIYASSSSVYGEQDRIIACEWMTPNPRSPYAGTKAINEIQAKAYSAGFGVRSIGVRFFNVFGPRQNPASEYSAVIPKWAMAMLRNEAVTIYGDGSTTRDFTPVLEAVRFMRHVAESGAATTVVNGASGSPVSLLHIFGSLAQITGYGRRPFHTQERQGDIRRIYASTHHAAQYFKWNWNYDRAQLHHHLGEVVDNIQREMEQDGREQSS
jgi:UDP-glucose 4-epimerase